MKSEELFIFHFLTESGLTFGWLSLKQIQILLKNEDAVSLESCFFAEDSEFLKVLN